MLKFTEWLQANGYEDIIDSTPPIFLKNLDARPDFQFRDDGTDRPLPRVWRQYKEYLATQPTIH